MWWQAGGRIIFSEITWHVQNNWVIRPNQNGLMKGRSYLTNLICFYDRVTHVVDEGRGVEVVQQDFSKAFDTVSHSILLEKLAAHGLDRYTLFSLKNWLDSQVHRVVVNGIRSSWQVGMSDVPQGVGIRACPVQFLY